MMRFGLMIAPLACLLAIPVWANAREIPAFGSGGLAWTDALSASGAPKVFPANMLGTDAPVGVRLAQVLLPDASPGGPLPGELAPPRGIIAPSANSLAPSLGATSPSVGTVLAPADGPAVVYDPFSWVEGHLSQFHDPLKYYP